MCVFQVILAYESIVLYKCSGKYIDIYFSLKITFWENQKIGSDITKYENELQENSECRIFVLNFGFSSGPALLLPPGTCVSKMWHRNCKIM